MSHADIATFACRAGRDSLAPTILFILMTVTALLTDAKSRPMNSGPREIFVTPRCLSFPQCQDGAILFLRFRDVFIYSRPLVYCFTSFFCFCCCFSFIFFCCLYIPCTEDFTARDNNHQPNSILVRYRTIYFFKNGARNLTF